MNTTDAFEYLERDTLEYTCIYLDPPYGSGRDYALSASSSVSFTDKFTPDEYESWIGTLVGLCKKRLAPDGTLWFHIASEYSFIPEKVLRNEFRNVEKVYWKKSHGKNMVKTKMGSVIDVIFRCFQGTPVFNVQYVPLDPYYFEHSYRNTDARGLYALGALRSDRTRRGHVYTFRRDDVEYTSPNGWKVNLEAMNALFADDRLHFVPKSANIYKKLYKHECQGKPLSNLWDDISYITRTQMDPRVYPTQKPVKLLERIVSLCTNEGDLVLDPMAGSGTTGIVCEQLNRRYILVDVNPEARKVFESRVSKDE